MSILRHLSVYLILVFLLGACATVPKSDSSKAAAAPDFSRPNLYSTYYFLSGSFASFQDPMAAKDQYQKALSHDPASPQIKRALLRSQMDLFGMGNIPGEEMKQILDQARLEQQFEFTDVYNAMRIYEVLNDRDGVDWALNEISTKHDTDTAEFVLYSHQYSNTGRADTGRIKRILAASSDKDFIAWALAAIHQEKDPRISLDLLSRHPNYRESLQLWLDIMVRQKRFPEIAKSFAAMEYPAQARDMMIVMDTMRQQQRADVILPHANNILDTRDKSLIAMLSELAYYANDPKVISAISSFLLNEKQELEMDPPIAGALISYALLHEDANLPVDALSERVTGLEDALNIGGRYRYSKVALEGMDSEAANKELNQRIVSIIKHPQLRELLHTSDDVNLKVDSIAAFLVYLAENNLCSEEDYASLMDHAIKEYSKDETIRILRMAAQNFPTNPLILNNLGYYLLDDPLSWDEAEGYISKALEYEPESESFLDSMAWLQYLKGNIATAASYIPKISASLPMKDMHPELLYHIGMIRLAQGNKSEAQSCLELISDPTDEFWKLLDAALNQK